MNRQLVERAAQEAFERNMLRLKNEIALGTAARHIDVLVELLESLLPDCGSSLLVESYRKQLADIKRGLASPTNPTTTHPHLRIVK